MPLHIKHHVQLKWPRARFLSLAGSKLRLCSANHRVGYFSNLACDWLSIVWAYSEQETENRPRTNQSFHCIKLPGPWDTNNEQSMIEKNIFQNISKGQPRSELWHNIRLDGPEDPLLQNSRFPRSRDHTHHVSIPLAQTPWGLTGRAWLQAGAQRVVIVVSHH